MGPPEHREGWTEAQKCHFCPERNNQQYIWISFEGSLSASTNLSHLINHSDLFSHWCHIFSSYTATFGISYKQSQGIILSNNQYKRVGYIAISNFWSLRSAFHILYTLSFVEIYYFRNKIRDCLSLKYNELFLPGSRTRIRSVVT